MDVYQLVSTLREKLASHGTMGTFKCYVDGQIFSPGPDIRADMELYGISLVTARPSECVYIPLFDRSCA